MNSKEGATRSGDSSRDNWRTPKWLMDVLHAEFGDMWDATGRGEQDWAHGCFDGNDESDALLSAWPKASPVFCNPPFSAVAEWSKRIAAHTGPTITVCKLTPSTRWWRILTNEMTSGVCPQTDNFETTYGTIVMVGLSRGVTIWLLPKRVAYEPPPGIKASAPSFDSCVVVRR